MNTNIFRDGILIDINVSFWSGARALRPEDLGLKVTDVAEAFKLGRKFLVPSEVIKKFRRLDSKARRIVEENSFRFPIGNAHFIPKASFAKAIEQLKEVQTEYDALADELIENYDQYREEMVPVYREAAERAFINTTPETQTFGPDYDRDAEKEKFVERFLNRIGNFYPPASQLRKRFSLSWDLFEMAMPRLVEADANQVILDEHNREFAEQEYRKQMHEKMDSFINDAVSVLRNQTVEICNRISANLREGKVVQGRTLQSLKDFVDKFQGLNFVGDVTVESQLESLRKEILDIYPVQKINDEEELQVELGRKLNEIAEVASQTTDIDGITSEYRRRIQWTEEEEEVAA